MAFSNGIVASPYAPRISPKGRQGGYVCGASKAKYSNYPIQYQRSQIQSKRCRECAKGNQERYILMDVMSQLMSQHGFDLVCSELVEQGVAQYDTTRVADACQRGVGRFRSPGHVELEHASHPGIGLLRQPEQTLRQVGVSRPPAGRIC